MPVEPDPVRNLPGSMYDASERPVSSQAAAQALLYNCQRPPFPTSSAASNSRFHFGTKRAKYPQKRPAALRFAGT